MSDEEYEAFAGSSSASPTAVWVWSNGNLLDDDDKDEDDVWAVAEVQTIEEGPPLQSGGRRSLIKKSIRVSISKDDIEKELIEQLNELAEDKDDVFDLEEEAIDGICRNSIYNALKSARKSFDEGKKKPDASETTTITVIDEDSSEEPKMMESPTSQKLGMC